MAKTILVIEPEDSVRDVIAEFLENQHFKVISATTGEKAINIAREKLPDLIVCNLVLPDGEGYQVLEAVRYKKETQSISFIIITNQISHKSYRFAMELGADDYLVKPFTNEELIEAIKSRLKRQEALESRYQTKIKQLQKQLQSKQEKEKIQEEVWNNLLTDLSSNLGKMKLAIHLLHESQSSEKKRIYLELLEQECLAMIDLINRISELRVLLTPDHLELLQRYNKRTVTLNSSKSENPKML